MDTVRVVGKQACSRNMNKCKIKAVSLKMKITEAHFSILKVAAGGSSEILVNIYHTTRRHITEDSDFIRDYLRACFQAILPI